MKIISYKKVKNGQYKIVLEDCEITLHEDLILKNNLLISKEITNKKIKELEAENKKYLIYDEALRYLKTRLRSRKEMYNYLEKKEYEKNLIMDVLDMLEKQKYLDDTIYVQAYINDKINLTNDGPYKIIKELQANNIDKKIIDTYIINFKEDLQIEKIQKLIKKKIKANHNKSKRVLKQKIINDLSNLGYSMHLINDNLYLLNDISDEQLKKQEYDKIYAKLSKKYSGQELEYRIKQKMIQKGFY